MAQVARRRRPWSPVGGSRSRPAPPPRAAPVPREQPGTVTRTEGGPYLCENIVLKQPDGTEEKLAKTALCACGKSSKSPFCDGSHARKADDE